LVLLFLSSQLLFLLALLIPFLCEHSLFMPLLLIIILVLFIKLTHILHGAFLFYTC
jgi:hypothetical protein